MSNAREIRENLDRIKELAPKLNKVTEDAGIVLHKLEYFLRDLVGLGVTLRYEELRFEKIEEGGWKLTYKGTPVDHIRRMEKIEAVSYVPFMLRKANQEIERIILDAEKCNKIAISLLEGIEGTSDHKPIDLTKRRGKPKPVDPEFEDIV